MLYNAILDNTGAVVVKYKYDAWGMCIIDASTTNTEFANINLFRYRSYFFDKGIGLYFLKTRYYDPEIGRFMTIDDISYLNPDSINGLNLYAYCLNNPVMYSDGSGHAVDFILDLLFIGWDIYNLVTNEGWKSLGNWVALGIDIAFAVVPFLTGGGSQIVKLANVSDDIFDFNKITVVGETMTRVQTISQFVNANDNLYDGFKAYDRLSDLGKGGKILAEIGGKSDNLAWLYGKLRRGYTVVDIGIDIGRTARSSSYFFERFLLTIWKYRNIWKLPYHAF